MHWKLVFVCLPASLLPSPPAVAILLIRFWYDDEMKNATVGGLIDFMYRSYDAGCEMVR